jgi:hypothetical protein
MSWLSGAMRDPSHDHTVLADRSSDDEAGPDDCDDGDDLG